MTLGPSSVLWDSTCIGNGLRGRRQATKDTKFLSTFYISPPPVWVEVYIFNLPCFPVVIIVVLSLLEWGCLFLKHWIIHKTLKYFQTFFDKLEDLAIAIFSGA